MVSSNSVGDLDQKDGVKDVVPYLAGHTKTEFKVLVMVGQVVFLHFLEVCWEPGMVQCVMHTIIKDIEGKGPRDDTVCYCRREDKMSQPRERGLQKCEQSRWHNQAEPIHRKIMVNPMHQEMERQKDGLIREPLIDVEQKPVHAVLEHCPNDVSDEETQYRLDPRVDGDGRDGVEGQPWAGHERREWTGELEGRAEE